MTIKYLERCRFSSATTGTGSITVGSNVGNNFMTPAVAGGIDGDQITYVIEEGDDFEIGIGTLSSSATVLSRDTVLKSMISGVVGTTKMTLLGNELIRVTLPASLTMRGPNAAVTDSNLAAWNGTTGTLLKDAGVSIGTSGAAVPKLNTANTWDAVQTFDYPIKGNPYALTSATGWDGSQHQCLTVNVNGANFTIANPSTVPAAGIYVSVYITYTTTHSVSWGTSFKGISAVSWSNTSGKADHAVFRSNGTQLELVGYNLAVGS